MKPTCELVLMNPCDTIFKELQKYFLNWWEKLLHKSHGGKAAYVIKTSVKSKQVHHTKKMLIVHIYNREV
jgi:hypothetical protein